MERFESSAWTLAGGALSVSALAVVLKHASWQVAFAFLVIAAVPVAAPVVAPSSRGGLVRTGRPANI